MILVVAESRRVARQWADCAKLRPSPDLIVVGSRDLGKGRMFREGDRVVLVGDVDERTRLGLQLAMPDGMEIEEVAGP